MCVLGEFSKILDYVGENYLNIQSWHRTTGIIRMNLCKVNINNEGDLKASTGRGRKSVWRQNDNRIITNKFKLWTIWDTLESVVWRP